MYLAHMQTTCTCTCIGIMDTCTDTHVIYCDVLYTVHVYVILYVIHEHTEFNSASTPSSSVSEKGV